MMQANFTQTQNGGSIMEYVTLDSGESLFFSHYGPKTVEWFMTIV